MTSAGDGSGDVPVAVMATAVSAVMVTAVVAVMVTVIAVVSRPKPPVENFAGGYGRAIRGQSCPFFSEAGDCPGVGPVGTIVLRLAPAPPKSHRWRWGGWVRIVRIVFSLSLHRKNRRRKGEGYEKTLRTMRTELFPPPPLWPSSQ